MYNLTQIAHSAAVAAAWDAAAQGGTEVTGPLTQSEFHDFGTAYVPGFREAVAVATEAGRPYGDTPTPERWAAVKQAAYKALGL